MLRPSKGLWDMTPSCPATRAERQDNEHRAPETIILGTNLIVAEFEAQNLCEDFRVGLLGRLRRCLRLISIALSGTEDLVQRLSTIAFGLEVHATTRRPVPQASMLSHPGRTSQQGKKEVPMCCYVH